MITLRNRETGERQFVNDLEGIDLEVWEETAEPVPADLASRPYTVVGGTLRPVPKRRITRMEFLQLLTPIEAVQIDAYPLDTLQGQLLRYGNIAALAAEAINLDSAEVGQFLAIAVEVGLLTPARAARVQAGLPPEVHS